MDHSDFDIYVNNVSDVSGVSNVSNVSNDYDQMLRTYVDNHVIAEATASFLLCIPP